MAQSFSAAMRSHMHMGAAQAMRAAWADVRAGRALPPPKGAAARRVALAVRHGERNNERSGVYWAPKGREYVRGLNPPVSRGAVKNPQVFDQGAFYSVTMTRRDVENFKSQWPASGLPSKSVTFQFDKRNGDLVDITPYRYAHRFDGPAAVALSQDAQSYGRRKLRSRGQDVNPTRRYRVQRLASPRAFDPRSFRTVTPKRGVKITVACPKGKYHRHTKRCRVPMKAQRIMRRRNPLTYSGVPGIGVGPLINARRGVTPIYGRVLTITARKTEGQHRGKSFIHRFGPHAKAYGLPNGDVLLTARRLL